MSAWWDSLDTALKIFYAIGIGSTFVMFLQLLAMLLGFDGGEGDADMGGDFDGDAGVHVLSVRSVIAFFAGFGWGGVVAVRGGLSLPMAILVASLIGGALMLSVYFLMRLLFSMRYSGTLDYQNAIGQVGNVYLPVPAAMAGAGQVEVLVQGRLAVVRAFTRHEETLGNRVPVRVVGVIDQQTLLVDPLSAEAPPSAEKVLAAAATAAPVAPAASGAPIAHDKEE